MIIIKISKKVDVVILDITVILFEYFSFVYLTYGGNVEKTFRF